MTRTGSRTAPPLTRSPSSSRTCHPDSQVAVASREPVDLPLARWRAQGSTLLEFGPAELAMDAREADALARRLGPGLPDHVIERLTRRTEGWPALLALATRAAREPAPVDADLLPHGNPAVTAYLRAELLDRRSEEEVAFLTRTSILERLNGPLCDAVTGGRGSAGHLADLARSTLLVDEYGGWFRYHLLLREFLAAELRGTRARPRRRAASARGGLVRGGR